MEKKNEEAINEQGVRGAEIIEREVEGRGLEQGEQGLWKTGKPRTKAAITPVCPKISLPPSH